MARMPGDVIRAPVLGVNDTVRGYVDYIIVDPIAPPHVYAARTESIERVILRFNPDDRESKSYSDSKDLSDDYILPGYHRFTHPDWGEILVYKDHISLCEWLSQHDVAVGGWFNQHLKTFLRGTFETITYAVTTNLLISDFTIDHVVVAGGKIKLKGLEAGNTVSIVNYKRLGQRLASFIEDICGHNDFDTNEKLDLRYLVLALRTKDLCYAGGLFYHLQRHPFFMTIAERNAFRVGVSDAMKEHLPPPMKTIVMKHLEQLYSTYKNLCPDSWIDLIKNDMGPNGNAARYTLHYSNHTYTNHAYSFCRFCRNMLSHNPFRNPNLSDMYLNRTWPGYLGLLFILVRFHDISLMEN